MKLLLVLVVSQFIGGVFSDLTPEATPTNSHKGEESEVDEERSWIEAEEGKSTGFMGREERQHTNHPQVSGDQQKASEGVFSEGDQAGGIRGQGSIQTEERGTTAFTGREDQPLEERDTMDHHQGDHDYRGQESRDTGGQDKGQRQRQDTEQVRSQREKDQVAGGQVYHQTEKNEDTGEQDVDQRQHQNTGGHHALHQQTGGKVESQWKNQDTGEQVVGRGDRRQDRKTGEQIRSDDVREQVRSQKQHQDTQHRQDRGPDVLHQRVGEQDNRQEGHQNTAEQDDSHQDTMEQDDSHQDTVEQDDSHQDTVEQDARHQDIGEKDNRQDDLDPLPDEEDELYYEEYVEGVDLIYSIDPYDKARGFELLRAAAEEGNNRALETLAYAYIFGSYLGRNFTHAFEIFTKLADKGNPIGQQGLGFMYSTGIGVRSNQAKAVVNYVFAALGGHQFAQMAMGYRAHLGVSVIQSCEGALAYYQKSADQVVAKASMASADITVSKVRLMDEDDETPSIYGVSEDEMLHYQNLFTDSGNTRAQFSLGIYYMMGLAGAKRSFEMALDFLKQAAGNNFPAAYVLMGKIYVEGSEEIEQDFDLAYDYFKAAADLKYGDGFSGLGWLYYTGMGVQKDKQKAMELFQKAADKGSPEGHYYLGIMYYNGDGVRRDIAKGIKYLQLASHGAHLNALHLLGTINADGSGTKRSCSFAVELFKSVSERGMFTRMFSEARRLYAVGDVDSSFLMYSLLAELGFEEAQSNVAYLLEQGDLTFLDDEEEQLQRALLFWNRAAAQGYHQARVKLGDYYYYGMGTEVSFEAAATQYRMASDKLGTPQAMFNLGYMYEHGEGLEKDYHLAKRYYDLAAQTSTEAVVPASMALFKLNVVYTVNHYREWLDFQEFLGSKWDIYLITVLAGVVVILVIWRTRH